MVPSVVAVVLVLALVGGLWLVLRDRDGGTVAGPATTSPVATSGPATSTATASTPPPSTPPATPTAAPASSAAATSAPATQQPANRPEVVVLNQSGRAGLAGRTATTLRTAGWTVSATGNFRGTVMGTTVYYPPGLDGAAAALAADLPGEDRIRPVFGNLSRTRLTVVLTSSYPG